MSTIREELEKREDKRTKNIVDSVINKSFKNNNEITQKTVNNMVSRIRKDIIKNQINSDAIMLDSKETVKSNVKYLANLNEKIQKTVLEKTALEDFLDKSEDIDKKVIKNIDKKIQKLNSTIEQDTETRQKFLDSQIIKDVKQGAGLSLFFKSSKKRDEVVSEKLNTLGEYTQDIQNRLDTKKEQLGETDNKEERSKILDEIANLENLMSTTQELQTGIEKRANKAQRVQEKSVELFDNIFPDLRETFNGIKDVFTGVSGFLTTIFKPFKIFKIPLIKMFKGLKKFKFTSITKLFSSLKGSMGTLVTTIWSSIAGVASAIGAAIAPFLPVIVGVGAAIAGLYVIFKQLKKRNFMGIFGDEEKTGESLARDVAFNGTNYQDLSKEDQQKIDKYEQEKLASGSDYKNNYGLRMLRKNKQQSKNDKQESENIQKWYQNKQETEFLKKNNIEVKKESENSLYTPEDLFKPKTDLSTINTTDASTVNNITNVHNYSMGSKLGLKTGS